MAAPQGDTTQLVTLLDPDVVRTADPQVLQPGRAQLLAGQDVQAALVFPIQGGRIV